MYKIASTILSSHANLNSLVKTISSIVVFSEWVIQTVTSKNKYKRAERCVFQKRQVEECRNVSSVSRHLKRYVILKVSSRVRVRRVSK